MVFLFAAAGLMSAAASAFTLVLYGRLPPAWFCEYGEEPGAEHGPARRRKHRLRRAAMLGSICMAALLVQMLPPAVTSRTLISSTMLPSHLVSSTLVLSAGLSALSFSIFPAFVILAVAALSDLDYRIIPDQCCLALPAVSAVSALAGGTAKGFFTGMFQGALLAGGLMALAMIIGRLAAGAPAVGMGDLKLTASCGACIGALYEHCCRQAVLCFFSASVLLNGAVLALLLITGRVKYGESRAFGPWIALTALIIRAAA